ncbi:hypothetical protein PsYK624_091670 [Phanerochaete sordida]|uniref:Uncharacterized protein n=1 Tax=Phanerochaete sordida TaxID=48140 RepID=A0A9P3GDP9_9APHY|nr:hypothetical protein PsYK624_091670 [Phanerochaete sordida]
MLFNKSIFATFALAAAVAARPHDVAQHHHAAAGGPHVDPAHNSTLLKRGQSFQSVRLSMYYPETGNQVACGGYYHDNDMIVALNAAQFEAANGAMCGQQITLTRNGKSVQATIVDECPSSSCPYGGLDCSPAIASALGFFNDLVWDGAWTIGGGDPAPASSSQAPPPPPSPSKTSSTPPPPPPSSTSKSHTTTTTTSSSTPSSTPASTSSTVSSSSSSSSSAASAASSAAVTPTPTATPASNIANLYTNIVNMALLAAASENTH